MKKEKAIEYLNDVRNGIHIPAPGIELPLLNDKEKEAIDLAIAALEQQEQEKWVPVTERLPEECEEVNITWVNTCPGPYYKDIKDKPFTGSGLYCKGRWYWYSAVCKDYLEEYGISQGDDIDDDIIVTAWRLFPEPYQEGET